MRTRRSARLLAMAAAASLVVTACSGDDDGGDTGTEGTATEATATDGSGTATDGGETAATGADGEAAMRVTYTLADTAVWNDGTPITAADFECTWLAFTNTPESVSTTGYDQIVGVSGEGNQVIVDYGTPFAAWKTLFTPILEASQHADCNDVSGDFDGAYTYGANPYIMTEWTPEQIVFEANADYRGPNVPTTDRIVIVPAPDAATPLRAGAVDFVFPTGYTGLADELADPNIEFGAKGGGQFEALYFQQGEACTPDATRSCALQDDVFREAFSKSIDRDAVYQQIYAPFAAGLPLLDCGPIAPGPYCDDVFADTYDPEGAATLLTDNGWTRGAGGMWTSPDGEVPEIHWMVNTESGRRTSTQEFLIPKLAEAGFDVAPDNCEALPCVFETRLPALGFDLGMFALAVAPDPVYLTSLFSCEQVPTEANGFQGQNSTGWCDEDVTAKLHEADATLDEDQRIGLVKDAIAAMVDEHVMLPLLLLPNVGAYRTDKVAGTQNNLANFWAFQDWWNFEDLDGDGQIVIGAEQYPTPDCTNPITACANSAWFAWVAQFPQFPSAYWPTDDQTFVPGDILAGEATVEEL